MMAMTAAEKQKRYRERKSNAKAVTNGEVTQPEDVTDSHYPGGEDCGCWMCHNYRQSGKTTEFLNHGPALSAEELGKISPLARNRQSLPGDEDYDGVALRMPGAENLRPAPNRTATRTQAREQARLERAQA